MKKNLRSKIFNVFAKPVNITSIKASKRLSRLLIPMLGLISLIWILIRVIQKPNRATYPCMRVVFPMASGFVIYLLGMITSVFAFLKAKRKYLQSRYILMSIFVLLALVGSLLTMQSSIQPAKATFVTTNHTPNAPIGEAKGIYPGRVVWVHNADATNEFCDPTKYGHGWFLNENNDQDEIDRMLSDALKGVSGESSDFDAWNAVFKYHNNTRGKGEMGYVSGEKIFIKINATSSWWGNINSSDLSVVQNQYYGIAETSPQLVLSVLKQLINVVGVAQEDIYVGDPLKHIYKHIYELWQPEFPNVHYLDHDGWGGREKVVKSQSAAIYYSDRGKILRTGTWSDASAGEAVTEDYLYTIFDEMEYMLNIPTLKAHKLAGVTMFAKNHFGSQTRDDAKHLHGGLVAPEVNNPRRQGYGMYRVQVDLMGHELLGEKNLLYLMDGLWSSDYEIDEPDKWTMTPFNNDWMSSIFLSLDAVAIESGGFDFLRTEFTVEGGLASYPQMEGVDDYLHQAADSTTWPEGIIYDPENDGTPISSLGVHEHWNNAIEKKYSRNLGTGNGIELISIFENTQLFGFLEDFNDNILSGWQVPTNQPYTFELLEQDSSLKIIYHRVAQSWEWDNINFTPPQPINVSNTPLISVKAKSGISTELTFKPIYDNGNNDWLQVQLPADDIWHDYIFQLMESKNSPMNRIYIYLDGGTTALKTGVVYFDDLRIGDSVRVKIPVDLAALETALFDAQNLYDSSDEGNEEGQFAVGSKAALLDAINAAQSVHDSESSSQQNVNDAVWVLYDACVTFETAAQVSKINVVDEKASRETKYLFSNLDFLSRDFLMYGMHDATGYGVGWSNDNDRSDVKDVCGSYPAVYSWDANAIARAQDISGLKYRITTAYERGGIQTLCWHQHDPLDRGFYAKDVNNEKIVATILPGGMYHNIYKEKLLRLAKFFKSLRGSDGHAIPVIFRPYHEHDGDWFWWGVGFCTTQEYNSIWQFTVTYLRDSLNVHNLLYAISPSKHNSREGYLNIFPGDDYVDIYGMDHYFGDTVSNADKQKFLKRLQVIADLAEERFKVAALTEVGQESIPTSNWHTDVLLAPLKNDPTASRIIYAAVWRNANEIHHFAPYPGHPSVPDFLQFYNDPYTLFEDDLPNVYALSMADSIPPVVIQSPEENFIATDTTVTIEILTNEKAYLRYSEVDLPYSEMMLEFAEGQGRTKHSTTVTGEQGRSYIYYVRGVDFYGNEMKESAVVSFTIDTLQAPVYWTDFDYDYSAWKLGTAPLGYGNGSEITVTSLVRTVYFRHNFNVADAGAITYLTGILKYDNGAVIYLNGGEVERVNLPSGVINYGTWATYQTSGITAITFNAADISLLKEGTNMLAVEMHQNLSDSTDMIFDFRLITPDPLIEFGADWYYYDKGQKPDDQTIGSNIDLADNYQAYKYYLFQNYPNPFNPTTEIRYELATESRVELIVYNVLGKKVNTLVNQDQQAGSYSIRFNASALTSGIYLYQLNAGDVIYTKKMILLR